MVVECSQQNENEDANNIISDGEVPVHPKETLLYEEVAGVSGALTNFLPTRRWWRN